jgi:tetratricopeptide (TPR) repeat protein
MIVRCTALSIVLATLAVSQSRAEDAIVFAGGKGGKERVRRTGTINDYSGAGLVITTASGRQETIPAEKVLEIQATSTKEETSGDALKAAGKLDEALEAYRQAKRSEPRRWVVRRIMSKLVNGYELAGQIDAAGDEFLALIASDEETPYFSAIPLAWRTSAMPPTKAQAWQAASEPAAQLLGASWLLSGADRAKASSTLKTLSSDLDPRIAHLASAQLWRMSLVTASSNEIARWQQQIERMPPQLRAGPLLVLGDGMARTGKSDDALLAWLQVPLVYPQRETLSAEGYRSAAKALEKAGRADDAARVQREIDSLGVKR